MEKLAIIRAKRIAGRSCDWMLGVQKPAAVGQSLI